MLDERDNAFSEIGRALKLNQDSGDVLFRAALVYNHFGDDGKTLAFLKQAVQRGFSTATIRDTPDFDHLSSNSAFASLTSKN